MSRRAAWRAGTASIVSKSTKLASIPYRHACHLFCLAMSGWQSYW